MFDSIMKIESSVIQHGKENDRIYIMKAKENDLSLLLEQVNKMVEKYDYTKVFAKVPKRLRQNFLDDNYKIEATIPNFYNGCEDAAFIAKYISKEREHDSRENIILDVIKKAKDKNPIEHKIDLDNKFSFRQARIDDAEKMASVYKKVFKTYPFPIHEPNYIVKTMNENIDYFGIWEGEKIVALASCEMDIEGENVEMTDFATLPEYRGNKFALYLLQNMEQAMIKKNIYTAFTIARALSYGMNITFSKAGYEFCGTLINNTNISGSIESMNVWYKQLLKPSKGGC